MADLIKINPIYSLHILKLDQSTLKSDSKKLDGVKSFSIDFNELGINSSLKVGVQGQGLILHSDLESHRFYSHGDNTQFIPKRLSEYTVKIEKTVHVEEDTSQNNRNYPTAEFKSFTDCDDNYTRKGLQEVAPGMNLTPVWIDKNTDRVTSNLLSVPTNSHMLGKYIFHVKLKKTSS